MLCKKATGFPRRFKPIQQMKFNRNDATWLNPSVGFFTSKTINENKTIQNKKPCLTKIFKKHGGNQKDVQRKRQILVKGSLSFKKQEKQTTLFHSIFCKIARNRIQIRNASAAFSYCQPTTSQEVLIKNVGQFNRTKQVRALSFTKLKLFKFI